MPHQITGLTYATPYVDSSRLPEVPLVGNNLCTVSCHNLKAWPTFPHRCYCCNRGYLPIASKNLISWTKISENSPSGWGRNWGVKCQCLTCARLRVHEDRECVAYDRQRGLLRLTRQLCPFRISLSRRQSPPSVLRRLQGGDCKCDTAALGDTLRMNKIRDSTYDRGRYLAVQYYHKSHRLRPAPSLSIYTSGHLRCEVLGN